MELGVGDSVSDGDAQDFPYHLSLADLDGIPGYRKSNWTDYILRINCLVHDVNEGQITEVKGLVRRKQVLVDLTREIKY